MIITAVQLRTSKTQTIKLQKKISKIYSSEDNLWEGIEPHVTLQLCPIVSKLKPDLIKKLLIFAKDLQPIKFKLDKIELTGGGDSYYVMYTINSKSLTELHEKVLNITKNYSLGLFNTKYLKLDLSEKERQYLNDYGYHRIKEFFTAHITVGLFKTEESAKNFKDNLPPALDEEFTLDRFFIHDVIDPNPYTKEGIFVADTWVDINLPA